MTTHCAVCGKPIKDPSKARSLRMNTAYEPMRDDDPAADMGWFEVGPDCYRKATKALAIR